MSACRCKHEEHSTQPCVGPVSSGWCDYCWHREDHRIVKWLVRKGNGPWREDD